MMDFDLSTRFKRISVEDVFEPARRLNIWPDATATVMFSPTNVITGSVVCTDKLGMVMSITTNMNIPGVIANYSIDLNNENIEVFNPTPYVYESHNDMILGMAEHWCEGVGDTTLCMNSKNRILIYFHPTANMQKSPIESTYVLKSSLKSIEGSIIVFGFGCSANIATVNEKILMRPANRERLPIHIAHGNMYYEVSTYDLISGKVELYSVNDPKLL